MNRTEVAKQTSAAAQCMAACGIIAIMLILAFFTQCPQPRPQVDDTPPPYSEEMDCTYWNQSQLEDPLGAWVQESCQEM